MSKSELKPQYQIKENKKIFLVIPSYKAYEFGNRKRFLGIPVYDTSYIQNKICKYQMAYYKKLQKNPSDSVKYYKKYTKKIEKQQNKLENGSWISRNYGEKPSLYDSVKIEETTEKLEKYYNKRGFYRAQVCYDITQPWLRKRNKKYEKYQVNYLITEGQPHIINEYNYCDSIKDPNIAELFQEHFYEKVLWEGERFDLDKVSEERERIFSWLKDLGYYDLKKEVITFNIDTTQIEFCTKIRLKIDSPDSSLFHTRYTFDTVRVYYNIIDTNCIDTVLVDNIYYFSSSNNIYPQTSSNALKHKLYPLKNGSFYSSKALTTSRINLGSMDAFKIIKSRIIKTDSSKLDIVFELYHADKYQLSAEVGVRSNLETQTFPGPALNLNLKSRNVFHRYENFLFNTFLAVEGQTSVDDENFVYYALEAGADANLIIPQLLFPEGKFKDNKDRYNPNTTLTLGGVTTRRINYQLDNVKAAIRYNLLPSNTWRYQISPIDFTLINAIIRSENFQTYLDTLASLGNPLKRSFQNSLLASAIFNATHNSRIEPTINLKNTYLQTRLEMGALAMSDRIDLDSLGSSNLLLRGDIDGRYYYPVGKFSLLATRLRFGAVKVNDVRNIMPYQKFFFIGGPNSIRAWPARRLGPGSFVRTDANGNYIYPNEQPGEILMEGSIEFRFPIVGYLFGAFFVDYGNVWTFNYDSSRPGSQFQLDRFFQDIAVGSGAGLRFDFSFIVLRFDFAFKNYDPGREPGKRRVPYGDRDQFLFNFGIGYPF